METFDKSDFKYHKNNGNGAFTVKEMSEYSSRGAYQVEGGQACAAVLARCKWIPVRYPDEIYRRIKKSAGSTENGTMRNYPYLTVIIIAVIIFTIIFNTVRNSWTAVAAVFVFMMAGVACLMIYKTRNYLNVLSCLARRKGVTLLTLHIERLASYCAAMDDEVMRFIVADGILIEIRHFKCDNLMPSFSDKSSSSLCSGKLTAAVVNTGKGVFFYIC
ncbi:MAG: hypothetical protein ACI4EU_06790 [Butyrivibrio sp.]